MELQDKRKSQKQRENNVGRMVESIIGCKWSLSVLRLIRIGVNRPGEMQRNVEGLTTKVLNERLTKLYKFGIIDKKIYPQTPPKVEYNFTEFGEKFLKIVDVVENLQRELNSMRDEV
jgi:DNA-binding HxlR family transcriptional regulator